MAYCTNCGEQIENNAKFCSNCGQPVNVGAVNKENKIVSEPTSIPKPKKEKKKRGCCGTILWILIIVVALFFGLRYLGLRNREKGHNTRITQTEKQTSKQSEEKQSDKQIENQPVKTETEAQQTDKKDETVGGVRAEYKEALDSYEAFFDEYVEFMDLLSKDPTNVQLLTEMSEYMTKYEDAMTKMDGLESEAINDAETAYFIEVNLRIEKKLLTVAMTQ